MKKSTPPKFGLRSAAGQKDVRRAIGSLSHGSPQSPDIPRDADGAPRKARGIRQVTPTSDASPDQLDKIPVKPFSLKPKRGQ
ncbi:hypothetical protein [Roseibium limicola]|uniref:Uncharacterized protein n=1 Tax=Roseibium limicola TaxID=2816037 RepID=A0A939J5A2_9HYPH|nr:hypothetical protein [Roseibium limicola]MBO0345590.1 hypothetical protein [Roseibium limicola]